MTTANAVSAKLRKLGFNPLGAETPRTREGLRVSRGYSKVRFVADLDQDREAARLAADARSALAEAGYTVEPVEGYPAAFYVSR
jgi:hypothetical protein